MADSVGGGGYLPPVTRSAPLQKTPTPGMKDGQTVTSVPADPQLDQLEPPAASKTALDTRTTHVQDGVTSTPGLKKDESEDVDDKSYEELKEIEGSALDESKKLLGQTEELRVTDMALAALQGQKIDSRHKLNVTIQMPGEPPPPVQLIPMSKAARKRADIADLQKIAYEVLKDHKGEMLETFKPDMAQERLKALQETLESNADKMGKKDPQKPSNWKQKYETLQQKQVYIDAVDKRGRTEEVRGTPKPELPEHLKKAQVNVQSEGGNPDDLEGDDLEVDSVVPDITDEQLKPVIEDSTIEESEPVQKKSNLKRPIDETGKENESPNPKHVRFFDGTSPGNDG